MSQHTLLVALLEPVTQIEWQFKQWMKSHKRPCHLIKALILSDINLLLPSRAFSYRASSKQLHTYRLWSSHHRNLGLLTGTDSTEGSFINLSIRFGMFRVQLWLHPSKKSTAGILALFAPRKGMQCVTQLQGHLRTDRVLEWRCFSQLC